jgi:glutaredoxin
MPDDKQLVMYSRTVGCPFVTTAKRVLNEHNIPYREIYIDRDTDAKQRILQWTGFLSVPTLVIADEGEIVPYTDVLPLENGQSPRGIDRGPMITEASTVELTNWLEKHGWL